MSDSSPNSKLEDNGPAALDGDPSAMAEFLKGIISGPLYIPERYQPSPLTEVAFYPNDFINLLGLQDKDKVVVPVFSRPELIEEWCEKPLKFRVLDGAKLFEILPDDWWLLINPGGIIEKEVSPWEISILKGGESGIPEIVAELSDDARSGSTLDVRPSHKGEFQKLEEVLIQYAETRTEIESICIAVETVQKIDGSPGKKVLVGVSTCVSDPASVSSLTDSIDAISKQVLIGGDPIQVYVGGAGRESVMLGIFKEMEPLYLKKSGFIERVKDWLFGGSKT